MHGYSKDTYKVYIVYIQSMDCKWKSLWVIWTVHFDRALILFVLKHFALAHWPHTGSRRPRSFSLFLTIALSLAHFAHSALTRHDHDRNTPVGLERSSATDRSNSSAAAQGVHFILRLRRSRRRSHSRRQQHAIAPRSAGLVASVACALLSGL